MTGAPERISSASIMGACSRPAEAACRQGYVGLPGAICIRYQTVPCGAQAMKGAAWDRRRNASADLTVSSAAS